MVLLVVVVLVVAGLGVGIYAGKDLLGPSTAHAASEVTVVDDAGRSVTVSGTPTKIAVLQPSDMDIVYRLGLRADVIAVDCGTPSSGGLLADYTQAQVTLWGLASLPCITWLPSLDIQTLVSLGPDLVLSSGGIPVSDLGTLQSQYGIPSLYLDPASLPGISYDVTILGEVTGTTTTANQLESAMAENLTADENLLFNATQIPSVLLTFQCESNGYWTFGPGTFGNDLLTDAGAVSITGNDTSANVGVISGSYILAANPDVILVATGFGLNVSSYTGCPFWSSFSAAQAGHVYGLDATLLTEPDPSMIFGLQQILLTLHPELA